MNLMAMLINAARTGGNVPAMLQQMAQQNPGVAQAMRMTAGKTPQQIRSLAENMCRECGTSYTEMLNRLQGF